MKLSKKAKALVLRAISGQYYCEYIPPDWDELNVNCQEDWKDENTLEIFEAIRTEDIWSLCHDTSANVVDLLESGSLLEFN